MDDPLSAMNEPTAVITLTTCPDCQHRFDAALVPGGLCPRCLLAGDDGADDVPPGLAAWQPPSVDELQPLLPDYELLELVGRGGMGAVYKARQPSLDRLVAIKLLPAVTAEMAEGFTERFRNEARLLARMNHPGIVQVHDFGTLADGSCYFVMEYVDGTDVARMVAASGRLSPEHAASITADVCAALHYAHEAGIVHRDVKPANILVTRQGQVKVADFGLAKKHDVSQLGLTQTGTALGTPDFVAPESLITGMIVDHRADLYAVGVMLYQMLTGQIPRGVFKPASEAAATTPAFDGIVSKAMQADPEQRYQTAHDLRTDVQQAIQAKPQRKVKVWRWATLAAIVVGLGAMAAQFLRPSASPARTLAASTSATSTSGDVIAIAAGSRHSLALKRDGTVIAWGDTEDGATNVPGDLTGVVTIGAGSYANHSLAVRADGSVVAWGGNTHGECAVPAGLTGVIAVCGGKEHSLALKADGSVVAWGENVAGQCTVPGKATGVVKIAASSLMSAALTADHSLLAWGGQTQRQSKVPGKLSDVTDMATGGRFSLALNQAGAVIEWGVSRDEPVELPAGLGSDVIAISAGADHALALKKDGSVIAWGGNEHGQATVPAGLSSGVIAIAAGKEHSLALKRDGSVIAWGNNDKGQTTVPASLHVAPLIAPSPRSGTVHLIGADVSGRFSPPAGLEGVSVIAAGNTHALALRPDGTVVAWGDANAAVPAGLSKVVAIGAGCYASHSLAVREDGTVVAWGGNNKGQCNVPAGLNGVVAVRAGRMHSLALKADGTVNAWGDSTFSQCKVPPNLSDVIAISAGGMFNLALKKDGSVVAWGLNRAGQTTVPEAAQSGVTAIYAGSEHVLALKADGSVIGWGSNEFDQATVPEAALTSVCAVAAGLYHSVALKTDGTVIAWGRVPEATQAQLPAVRAKAISAGGSMTLCVTK